MRNLKKLLALIVAICVLATFTVPAFAADTAAAVKADTQTCANITMLVGQGTGVTAEYGATTPTRIQAAVMVLRLTGNLAAAQAFTGTENFADAATANWAKPLMGYLKANPALGFVGDGTKFNPNAAITAQEYYKVLLTALGYAIPADYAFADTLTFAKDTAKLAMAGNVASFTVDALATATVEALKATPKAATKTLAATLVDAGKLDKAAAITAGLYADVVTAAVTATGAKKLTVTFNQAVDTTKAVFVAKRGTVTPSVKSVTFAADKKSAVIEFSTAMAAGDYTVTVTGLTDKAISATVAVVASKLVSIKFLSDLAVISNNNVTTSILAENQYAEDITDSIAGSNVTTSKGTSASVNSDGLITVIGTAGLFEVDDTFVVTVVNSATGVSATKTLKVSKGAAVESIVFGTLATDDKDLKDAVINVTAMTSNASKYYLPVTVKDQYGNTLKAGDLGSSVFSLISSNTKIVKLASTSIVDDADLGTLIKFQTADATATSGTVVLTAVATTTGKTANTTIVVKDNAELDVVTLSAPATEVKLNTAIILPVSVVDTYSEEVALDDITFDTTTPGQITLNADTKITAVNATFTVVKDYVKDVKYIKIKATDENVILTVTTATGKYQSLTLVADDAPVATAIKGIDSDFVTRLANDGSLYTDLKDMVIFVDQYGEEIDAPTFGVDYTIAPDDSANAVTSYNTATGRITASTTAGTEVYVVTLKNEDGDTIDSTEVTVTVVDKEDIAAFSIDDLNKFYTGATATSIHNQQVKIHGLVDGNKVVVNQNMIVNVTASAGLVIASNGAYTAQAIDSDDADVKAVVTALVVNDDETYVVTKDVVYSEVAPKAAALAIEYDGGAVEAGTIEVPVAELNKAFVTDGASKLQFIAEDQYGVQRVATVFNFVVTNNGTGGAVSTNGTGSGFDAGDVGESLQLNVFVDGLFKTLKVFVVA